MKKTVGFRAEMGMIRALQPGYTKVLRDLRKWDRQRFTFLQHNTLGLKKQVVTFPNILHTSFRDTNPCWLLQSSFLCS